MPHNEGGFRYGWGGIFRAASVIFFAYVGFEAVFKPRRLKRGIRGVMCLSASLEASQSAPSSIWVWRWFLLGIVPYRQLDVADPLAIAVSKMHAPF